MLPGLRYRALTMTTTRCEAVASRCRAVYWCLNIWFKACSLSFLFVEVYNNDQISHHTYTEVKLLLWVFATVHVYVLSCTVFGHQDCSKRWSLCLLHQDPGQESVVCSWLQHKYYVSSDIAMIPLWVFHGLIATSWLQKDWRIRGKVCISNSCRAFRLIFFVIAAYPNEIWQWIAMPWCSRIPTLHTMLALGSQPSHWKAHWVIKGWHVYYMLNTVGRCVQPRIIFKIVVHDKIAQKGAYLVWTFL